MATGTPPRRLVLRRFAGLAAGLALAGVVLLAALIVWVNTDSGRARLAGLATATAAAAGLDLEITGLEGRLPYRLSATRVTLADGEGVWLDVRDLRFSWNPWALALGRLRVHEVAAADLALKRIPEPGAEPAEPESAPGDWPARIAERLRIESVEFPRIHLAEPVLGRAVTFSVIGQFGVRESDAQIARLAVTGLEGHKTSLDARGTWRPATEELGVEVRGRAEPGGVVAGLVGVAPGDSVDLTLTGTGRLEDWAGVLEARAGAASADIDLLIRQESPGRVRPAAEATGPARAVTLRLSGHVDAADLAAGRIPEPAVSLIEGGVDLRATLEKRADGGITLHDLLLESPALAVTGAAAVDREDRTVDGRIRVRQPEGRAIGFADFSLAGLDAELMASGPWARPRLGVEASLSSLVGTGVSVQDLDLRGEFERLEEHDQRGPPDRLRLSARASGLAWNLPGMQRLVRGPALAEVSGIFRQGVGLTLDTVRIGLPDAVISGTMEADLDGRSLLAPLEIELLDLNALDPLVGVDLEGRGRLRVDLELPDFGGALQAAIEGQLSAAQLGVPVAGALVSSDLNLRAEVDLEPGTGLRVPEFRLAGERAVITGNVFIPAGFEQLVLEATAEVPDGRILSSSLGMPVAGRATARAQLDGPIGNPGLTAELMFEELRPGGLALANVRANGRLDDLASGLHGPVSVRASGPTGQIKADTTLKLETDRLNMAPLRLAGESALVDGELAIHFDGAPLVGALGLEVDDAGPLFGWVDMLGRGTASGSLRFAASGGEQSVSVSVEATDVSVEGASVRALAAEQLTVRAQLTRLFSDPVLDARVDAAGVSGPSSDLRTLGVTASGPFDALEIDAETEGIVLDAPAELSAGVVIARQRENTTVTLTRLEGSLQDHAIESRGPAVLSAGSAGVDLADLVLGIGSGEVRADLRTGAPNGFLTFMASEVPLSLLTLVDPGLNLNGQAAGQIRLAANNGATSGVVELRVEDMRLSRRRRAAPIALRLDGELGPAGFEYRAQAQGGGASPLVIAGTAPVQVDLAAGTVGLDPDGPLSARLDWEGEASDLFNMLPPSDHTLRGPIVLAARVRGTPQRPDVSGSLVMSNARYEHLFTGTILEPLNARIVGDGGEIRIQTLEAMDGGKGTVIARGAVALDAEAGNPTDLSVEFDQARLVRRDDLEARASGTVRIHGAADALRIEGRIVTDEVQANLVNRLPPEVVELDVIEVGAPARDAGGSGPAAAVDADLDITVEIPQRLFVRGLGLDSEWEGRLEVGGTTRVPRVTGRLESVRGIMQFLGRRFRFEPSSITFAGGRKVEPELDIVATHEGTDLDVTARVSGPVTDIDIDLSSEPSVPEDEILSRTLFGKSTGELSGLEAVQLAAAVGELTGATGGPGAVMSRLRDTAGIDVLRFGSTETEEGEQATTLEAGKYLAEGLYLGVETSTAEESGAVSVEFDLTRRLRLKTDVEQAGGQNIGVEYKRDY
jgi:translocation and assembly module TamB